MSEATPIVGSKAPDFELQGYFKGELKSFKLSDFHGKWTYLLFYPLISPSSAPPRS
jgi:peroxiredoxin